MNRAVENKVIWRENVKQRRESHASSSKISQRPQSFSQDSGAGTSSREIEAQRRGAYHQAPGASVNWNDTPPLCMSMSTHWKDPALCRFFSDYVLKSNEVAISPGYLNHLPKIYSEATDEILTHAVSAVSLASFSNQVRSTDLLISARKSYGKALVLLKKALSTPEQVRSDGTLAGVFFCNMYEV